MRRLLVGSSVLVLLALTGGVPPAHGADRSISIVDNSFEPFDVTIGVGDTVTWRHTGQRPHSAQADDGQFNSSPGCSFQSTGPCMHNGATFSFTATRAGTIFYHCAVHGSTNGTGMAGTITVASSSTTSTAAPTTTRPATTTTRPGTTTTARGATTTAAGGATTTAAGEPTRPPDPTLVVVAGDDDTATSTTIPLAPVSTLAAPLDDDDDGAPIAIIIALVILAAALASAAFYYWPGRRA